MHKCMKDLDQTSTLREGFDEFSREQPDLASKKPLILGEILNGAADCVDTVAWTYQNLVSNGQIDILKVGDQLNFA